MPGPGEGRIGGVAGNLIIEYGRQINYAEGSVGIRPVFTQEAHRFPSFFRTANAAGNPAFIQFTVEFKNRLHPNA